MKIQNISAYALYACFALIAVVLLVFFLVGYDNPVGDYNSPENTELLIFLMYAMTVVCLGLMIWGAAKSAMVSAGSKGDNKSGVPGGTIAVASVAILVLSIIIGMVAGSAGAVTLADGSVVEGAMSKLSDVMIISIYILMIVAALGVVVNLTGVLKK